MTCAWLSRRDRAGVTASAWVLFATLLLLPIVARAETPAELKKQGIAAAKRKNWEIARQRFEAAYALDPHPLTLFSLADAQDHTGKLLAARTSYQLFLDQGKPGDNDKQRAAATEAVATLEKDIPTIKVVVNGMMPVDMIEVDGRALSGSEIGAEVQLDPGKHTVAVRRNKGVVLTHKVKVDRGDRAEVELTAPPASAPTIKTDVPISPIVTHPPPGHRPPAEHDDSPAFLRSPVFWGVAGAVALGVVFGGYYELRTPPSADPTRSSLGGSVIKVP